MPNVTHVWFIWNFFTNIVSQQTYVLFDTIFVKKFQMNHTYVTFGTREYKAWDCFKGSLKLALCRGVHVNKSMSLSIPAFWVVLDESE